MKKNLISVLILALLVVNTVVCAIIMISLVPASKQINTLITQICASLDLELSSGRAANASTVPIENIVIYDIPDQLTINLKDDESGESHYCVVKVSFSLDSTNADYEKFAPTGSLDDRASLLKSITNNVITKYTISEIKNNPELAQKQILDQAKGLYDSDFIIAVGFPQITCD